MSNFAKKNDRWTGLRCNPLRDAILRRMIGFAFILFSAVSLRDYGFDKKWMQCTATWKGYTVYYNSCQLPRWRLFCVSLLTMWCTYAVLPRLYVVRTALKNRAVSSSIHLTKETEFFDCFRLISVQFLWFRSSSSNVRHCIWKIPWRKIHCHCPFQSPLTTVSLPMWDSENHFLVKYISKKLFF